MILPTMQVDAVVDEAIKTASDGKTVEEAEFKRSLTDVLGSVMLRLNESPVFVSTNTVIHNTV